MSRGASWNDQWTVAPLMRESGVVHPGEEKQILNINSNLKAGNYHVK